MSEPKDEKGADFSKAVRSIAGLGLFIIAAILAVRGVHGWGWFLFVAVLIA